MKYIKTILFGFTGLILLTQTSCKKNDSSSTDEIETSFDLSSKQAVSETLTDDVNNLVFSTIDLNNYSFKNQTNTSVENALPPCVSIAVSGNFPNRIIKLDFGSGCTDTFGIFRSGIIRIQLSDSIRNYGSTATVTFDNFHIKRFKKAGSIIWTNLTPNNSFNSRTWRRQVQNVEITDTTDGRNWLHNSNKTITQYEGVASPRYRFDDKYKIYDGSGSVTNSNGTTRNTTILDTLFKSFLCPHIDKGSIKIERSSHFVVLNYGNGNCDNIATVTLDGNPASTRTIILP